MFRFDEEYGALSIRVCPACERAFYGRIDGNLTCPYCRYSFIERRSQERTGKEADIIILFKGRKVRAKLVDYSERGARVVFKDINNGIDAGIEVAIDICELHIYRQARPVWVKEVGGACVSAGFTLL